MKQASGIEGPESSAATVAVLLVTGSIHALSPFLCELDASAVSVVVWHPKLERHEGADLRLVSVCSGFTLRSWRDGALLEPGCVYSIQADMRVWFDGARLRAGPARQGEPVPLDHLLQSLAQVWRHRSMVMSSGVLSGDGVHGLRAVREAGGVVLGDVSGPAQTAGIPNEKNVVRTDVGAARVPLGARNPPDPTFRVQRFFPFSSAVLARLRQAAAVAIRCSITRDRVRVWVPGCKTGGLVYAIAMLLSEANEYASLAQRIQVFGTDHDEEALAVARRGRYPAQAALGMDPRLRGHYLVDEGETIRAAEFLRETCVFAPHKLTRNAPFSRMDLIVCQHVFDGFPRGRHDEVVDHLYFALREEGVLFPLDQSQRFLNQRFELAPQGYLRPRPSHAKALRSRFQRPALDQPLVTALAARAHGQVHGDVEAGRPTQTAQPDGAPTLELHLRAIGAPLLLLDAELHVVYMNDKAACLFGLADAKSEPSLQTLAARLPVGAALLNAVDRVVSTNRPVQVAISAAERMYVAQVATGDLVESGVAIVFTDVGALESATQRALRQQQQQAAIAQIAELGLRATPLSELIECALSLLLKNIPVCHAGVVVQSAERGAEPSVLASAGLGEEPLRTLRSWVGPFAFLERMLEQDADPNLTVHTETWGPDADEGDPSQGGKAAQPRGLGVAAPKISSGFACAILSHDMPLGIIALYSRSVAVNQDLERQFFLRRMTGVLGEAIARQMTERGRALELEISTIASGAKDVSELGRGLARAARAAVGGQSLEIWMPRVDPPLLWERRYPMKAGAPALPVGSRDLLASTMPYYRAPAGPGRLGELWLAVQRSKQTVALLRILGPALRAPDRKLSEALVRSTQTLGPFFERVEADDVSRLHEDACGRSSSELEALFGSLPVGASIHDSSGAIRQVNQQLSLLSSPAASLGGSMLERLYSEEMPFWVARVLGTGEAVHDLELSITEGSEVRSWLCNIAALRDVGGTVWGACAIVHDITVLKRTEAHLLELDRRKSDLLGLLGHELRNPIAAIRNATELLRRSDGAAARLPRIYGILDRQTLQTERLIDGLLDVSRISREKVELDKAPLQLVDLVRHVVDDRRHQFRERRLALQLPEEEVWVLADRARLTQVLDNLLSNALKFTLPRGLVHVELMSNKAKGKGSICISDDGVGIDPGLIQSIFEPFSQDRRQSASRQGGLGLGLAVVKGLVELHGFDLRVQSEGVGRGARFEIAFSTATAPPRRQRASGIAPRRLKIVLVEDNDDIAETLAELLTSDGHEVERASGGEAALSVLMAVRPDVFLCDIGLPGMDGVMVAERIRAEPEVSATKLVAMTGYGDAMTRQRVEDVGFDACLLKPIQHQDLVSCLARLTGPVSRHLASR